MPNNFVYVLPYVVLARCKPSIPILSNGHSNLTVPVYSNSLLVSLNSRARLDKQGTNIELSSSHYSNSGAPGSRRPFSGVRSDRSHGRDKSNVVYVDTDVEVKSGGVLNPVFEGVHHSFLPSVHGDADPESRQIGDSPAPAKHPAW
jgi:hypothetical protein